VGKLENQELKAKIRELMEENASLKQTNVEQKVQMDDNKVINLTK
jgi:regulator of replication initiation timing